MSAPDDPVLAAVRRALAGEYEVERVLGAGGMGSVLLARDLVLQRPVAIKVIAPELSAAETFRERFFEEARLVARMRHPHIVTVYTAGEADGLLWYAMEYVPGESLRDRLAREGRLPVEEARRILADLAGALAYAHGHGVVHRDIKPENVLLDRETGRALLADFGVARAFGAGGPRQTMHGFVVGSPAYMSPEQAAGERELDGRSDIYALGLVGYEMLAGEPAFGGTSAPSVIARQITAPPPPLAARRTDVPPELVAAIDRALAKDPDARWQSGDDFARAVAGPLSPAMPAAPAAPRARRRWWPAAAALLLVALVPAAWLATRRDAPVRDPRRSMLVVPFDVVPPSPDLEWLREGSVNLLTLGVSQWEDLAVADYERTLDLLRAKGLEGRRVGLSQARELARAAGMGTVVMGEVGRLVTPGETMDSLRAIVRLYDVRTGRPVGDEVVAAVPATSDPRALFTRVAQELLGISGGPPLTLDLARNTTSSLEAYQAYLRGTQALHEWRLRTADSLLGRAVTLDSTFALAWYRRALVRGWERIPDSTAVGFAQAAQRHMARLPAREQGLVQAYVALAEALDAGVRGDASTAAARIGATKARYAALVARDSADVEAWYGLGDAHFHDVQQGETVASNWTASLRAFRRTLALDSTFHLAYAHTISIYQQAGRTGSGLLLVGDSILDISSREANQAFGAEEVENARQTARRLAVRDAREWVLVDPDAPQSHLALADAYTAAGAFDSAAAVLREAMAQPASRTPTMPFRLAGLQLQAGDTTALATLRRALAEVTAAELREDGGVDALTAVMAGANVAGAAGALRELDRVLDLAVAVSPVIPGLDTPASRMRPTWRTALRASAGLVGPEERRGLDTLVAITDAIPAPFGDVARRSSLSAPYLGYVLTRDERYLDVWRRWSGADSIPAELEALAALERGDTAAAVAAGRRIRVADTAATVGAGPSAVRQFGRAEAFIALGRPAEALAIYEALDPTRFSVLGAPDPRWPLWVRSWLVRGQLHEQLGQRAEAAAAYRKFLSLWRDADAELEPHKRAAREGLARVTDVPG